MNRLFRPLRRLFFRSHFRLRTWQLKPGASCVSKGECHHVSEAVSGVAAIPAAGVFVTAEAQQGNEYLGAIWQLKDIDCAPRTPFVDLHGAKGAYRGIRVSAKRGDIISDARFVGYSDNSFHNEDRSIDMKQGERSRPINANGDKFVDHVNHHAEAGARARRRSSSRHPGRWRDCAAGSGVPLDKPVTCAMSRRRRRSERTGQPVSAAADRDRTDGPAPTTAQARQAARRWRRAVRHPVRRLRRRSRRHPRRQRNRQVRQDPACACSTTTSHINELKVIYANGETGHAGRQRRHHEELAHQLAQPEGRPVHQGNPDGLSLASRASRARRGSKCSASMPTGWLAPTRRRPQVQSGLGAAWRADRWLRRFRQGLSISGRPQRRRLQEDPRHGADRAITLNELRVVYADGAGRHHPGAHPRRCRRHLWADRSEGRARAPSSRSKPSTARASSTLAQGQGHGDRRGLGPPLISARLAANAGHAVVHFRS